MNNLRKLRGRFGLTQLDLANKLGLSRTNVTGMEKHITVDKAVRCAKLFHVNPIEVMGTELLKIEPKNEKELQMIMDMLKENYYVLEKKEK